MGGDGVMASFDEVLKDCTKLGTKIPTSEYLENGKYPIIDQGQNDIAGYYDSDDGLFEDVPTIVFGDHTRVVKYVDKPCFLGADGVKLLCPLDKDINCKYLFYQLSCADIPNTGYNRHFKWVKALNFKIPSSDEQNHVVEVLDKVTELISLRKQQLAKLDELVKARFVEMFGDPDQNPKGWPLVSITEIIRDKASNGFFAKRDAYKDDGNVQILGVSNVVNRMYSNTKELPRTNATQAEKEKYSVKYGDMLFCRSSLVADGIGKASIVAKGAFPNVLFECHVIRLSLDLQKCVPEFVQVLSTTPFFRRQIIAQSKTATMTTIGQDGILKSSVVLPPIDLQNQFAAFVERVDQQKQTVQQSLEKLELMKKALMQEYFG